MGTAATKICEPVAGLFEPGNNAPILTNHLPYFYHPHYAINGLTMQFMSAPDGMIVDVVGGYTTAGSDPRIVINSRTSGYIGDVQVGVPEDEKVKPFGDSAYIEL